MGENSNEFKNILKVYINTVDTLLSMSGSLCYHTKNGEYANFRVQAFKIILERQGRGENYRYYMKYFRIMSWIVCQGEKFSNPQRIKGDLIRVVTIDYKRYLFLKQLIEDNTYFIYLQRFMNTIDRLFYGSEKTGKSLYMLSKDGMLINVKSQDYRKLVKDECGSMEEYKKTLEVFRNFEWIICQMDSFTNIQKINGKAIRLISADCKKYELMKELLAV